ncbi:MAG: NADP-dependent malic enzyme [Desulfofustis sp.]|jgi:malate dehydrogenase (oxaloacetate-decarboxylating)(NADP+)|nr:NADP-dependent malic enzyme [Desulfofustis sp.]
MAIDVYAEALEYHRSGRKGKIEVVVTKPFSTQKDLSLAYSPGVARPCQEIAANSEDAYEYTAKGNLVAVISNGTAVLGLGNIGALAGKPVMEGKGALFKKFADIDVFDIEVATEDPDELIRTCELIAPTFGGINLEDIKAPQCFYVEETLKQRVDIPVFHDDQHGTAIITSAAFLNALEITGRDIKEVKAVFNGAGAAGIACARMFIALGLPKENLIICDSKGVIYQGRSESMNPYKEQLANDTPCRTLAEAVQGADVFCGVSVAGALTAEMLQSMAERPIVFAMANPEPEISYPDAIAARPDCIIATGRSDYPNQVNNVLCFPFLFRGALDVRAKEINTEMKIAAVRAIAELAKEEIPDQVLRAYGADNFEFGPEYLIPTPFDPRALLRIAPAVARAAMETGVARKPIADLQAYTEHLEATLGRSKAILRFVTNRVKKEPVRVVYPEGNNKKIIRAAIRVMEENIATPILLGNHDEISELLSKHGIPGSSILIVDPSREEDCIERYARDYYERKQRSGITLPYARDIMRRDTGFFGAMMLNGGDADCMIYGQSLPYPYAIRRVLSCVGRTSERKTVASVYMMVFKKRTLFFADTTVNINPSEQQLAEIAVSVADFVKEFDITPKIAMLSYSNFGSSDSPGAAKIARATALVKQLAPELEVEGEMQANLAFNTELREEIFPFSTLKGEPNILIFPDLNAANIAYKLCMRLAEVDAIGPILVGLNKSAHIVERGAHADNIFNLTTLAALKARQNVIAPK